MAATTTNRNLSVVKDEYAIFGKALPYVAMLIGGALLFVLGLVTRTGIWLQHYFADTPMDQSSVMLTWIFIISCIVLSIIAYVMFKQRAAKLKEPFIAWHATITTMLAHGWLVLSLWDNVGHYMFSAVSLYVYFYGALIITISWCLRRWSFRGSESTEHTVNPFEEVGLGKNTHLDTRNSGKTSNGKKFRMKLELGKTIEQAKAARVAIAQIAGKPRNLVHIRETDSGVEGEVDITIMESDPFNDDIVWTEPDNPGANISEPITYATYDDGTRPELYISGKNRASCQHWLTMGMSGAGKSKAWQAIYGSVLNRREVSVVFGDPAKGLQTGGPLASGLEWFEHTEEGCLEQIAAIMRAIPVRADYLTAKGLDHWVPGCGINFVIFHLEEAARFAKTEELVTMLEAARSAGISIVISLQRATGDRLKTSARYNLGGSMCFGVRAKRDSELALSESTRLDGAEPHKFQDRKPGHHFLEATSLDARMFAHELKTDWIDTRVLEQAVDDGANNRDYLDGVTASAFGMQYQMYRDTVAAGGTAWQKLRRGRNNTSPTQEFIPAYNDNAEEELDEPTQEMPLVNGTPTQPTLFEAVVETPREKQLREAAEAREDLMTVINDFNDHGQFTFAANDVLNLMTASRSRAWAHSELKKLVATGMLGYNENTKFYSINRGIGL